LGDLYKLHFRDKSFDFVCYRYVLEHRLDPVIVLNELIRVMKIWGALYCSVPLEDHVFGKHTTAILTMKSVFKILDEMRYHFEPFCVEQAKDKLVVILEGDEAVIFIIKKSQEVKKYKIFHA